MEERETKEGRGGKRVRDRGTEGRGGTEGNSGGEKERDRYGRRGRDGGKEAEVEGA